MRFSIAMLPALLLGGALVAQGTNVEGAPPSIGGEQVGPSAPVVSPGVVPTIVPASAANVITNRANSIPWSWTPTHFQSPYLEADMPNALVVRCVGFRHGNRSDTGATIDLEMWLGYTTYTPANITNNYANNANGPQTKVFDRKMFKVPDMVNPNSDPKFFIGQINCDRPFVWAKQAGRNLLFECKVYGNSNNNSSFSYFPEQGTSGTTRIYSNNDANAVTGNITRNLAPVLSLDLACKTNSDYETYGDGCPGTGGFAGRVTPANYATRFGTSNNYFPWGRANMRYQQCHDGDDLGTRPIQIDGLSLRQDDQTTGRAGGAQTWEILIGQTDLNPGTIGFDFAKNVDSNGFTVVFKTATVNIPTWSGRGTDPTKFTQFVKFDAPLVWIPRPGKDFIMEVVNTSTTNVIQYPDAASNFSDVNAARVYALSSSATMGTSGTRNYAPVLGLNIVGGVGNAKPQLGNSGAPKIGNATFAVTLSAAKGNTAVVCGFGLSDKMFGAIQLPFDLNNFGFTGCKLFASLELLFPGTSDGQGNASTTIPIPNDTNLVKANFYNQYLVVDLAANAGGLVLSDAGKATIGEQ